MKYQISLILSALLPLTVIAASVHADWKKDGLTITDDTYENMEVVPLDDGRYRMYFSQNGSILSDISTDGLNWTREEGTRISGAGMPAIVELDDGTLRLYFNRQLDEKNAVYSATSSDGLNFTEEAGVRLQAGHPGGYDTLSGTTHPTVIQLPSGRYRMYYDTFYTQGDGNTPWHILSAISDDGLTFTIEQGVRIKGKRDLPGDTKFAWSPHIQKRNGQYQLFVTAQYDEPLKSNGIYLATSDDGKHFTVKPKPIVYRDTSAERVDTDKGMNGAPQDPFVLKIDGVDTIYYWVVNKGIYRAHKRTTTTT
ncbi:MAG: exo-alpha-sialidase [Candidatus Kerfeldbacteria bacterium]|nr:exo-alpha-sialidase [Candidatus Kerfeldbacteria bacterium]